MALVSVAEPHLRAREHPLDRTASAGIDRIYDMKDFHMIALRATRRRGRDNRLAIASNR